MKKRILCLILTVAMLITGLGVLASCGDDSGVTPVGPNGDPNGGGGGTHEHSPSANWDKNAFNHYHSCSGCTEKLDTAPHDFTGDDNTVCTVCGYTCEHPAAEETEEPEYEGDATHHWIPDACGHNVNVTKYPHTFNLDRQCTTCGAFDHEHTFDTEWTKFNELYHWKAATCGCTANLLDGEYEYEAHSDADGDKQCDSCDMKILAKYDIEAKYSNYDWEDTEITICLNEHSNEQQLPSAHRRYLAGDRGGEAADTVDTLVEQRNTAAYNATHVTVKYEYWGTNDAHSDEEPAKWSTTVTRMLNYSLASIPGAPDIFINQIYDMVSAQLNGAFANTRSMIAGGGENYFSYTDPAFEEYATEYENEFGYMLEYMSELGFSKQKQYLVASDYFIDLVRAFIIVPLNLKLLAKLGVQSSPVGDRDGDRDSDADDFYAMVMNGEWTYDMLADFSMAIHSGISGSTGSSMNDINGWILSTSDGMYSSAILYTTSVKLFDREYDKAKEVYTCVYPSTNEDLFTFCDNLATLVGTTGIHVDRVAHTEIRDKFAGDQVLFGGIAMLGSLEYKVYQDMRKEKGFGILPVPLYQKWDIEYDENGEEISRTQEKYLTIIHNMGRIAAISATTDAFIQCTAYLDYQSTHSSQILNQYYEYNLQREIAGGSSGNIAILEYIRKNVRSAFDKTYEDAISYNIAHNTKEQDDGWHRLLMRNNYQCSTIRTEYNANAKAREGYLAEIVKVYTEGNSLPA